MSQAHSQIGILESVRKGMEDQAKRDHLAMKNACAGEYTEPTNLEQAARIIISLRQDRDKWKGSHSKMIDQLREETQKLPNLISEVLKGQPEDALVHDASTLKSLVTRLINERDKAKALGILENVRNTLIGIGFNEIPGLIGYFERTTPLLECAEAAAISISADTSAKEGYLRRRGWIMVSPNNWKDKDKNMFPFESAITIQTKRDIKPFAALGTRMWHGPNSDKTRPLADDGSTLKEIENI